MFHCAIPPSEPTPDNEQRFVGVVVLPFNGTGPSIRYLLPPRPGSEAQVSMSAVPTVGREVETARRELPTMRRTARVPHATMTQPSALTSG